MAGLDPGLDPAIGYPHQIANDAIAVSNHPMEMAGSSPAMTWLDRCVWYVNNQGGWYDAADGEAMPGVYNLEKAPVPIKRLKRMATTSRTGYDYV